VLAGAARAIAAVASTGQSADRALGTVHVEASLASAVRAITLGTLRWYLRLAPLAAGLLERRRLVAALHALLLAALHQLEYSRNPAQTTVSSAVDAARLLGQPRAAGLINALLRRYLRERTPRLQALATDPVASSAHPAWLLQALQEAWPAEWSGIIETNNTQPPMTLRVDCSRTSLMAYRDRLAAEGLAAQPLEGFPAALVLAEPVPVTRLPGFEEGVVSVQDAGAQLASVLLDPQPGERILDACAAPGGKTGALLEMLDGQGDFTAIDVDEARLARVADNLRRLRRAARLLAADLADSAWWDGQPFDRILLDAPCSAVGVIRRHPDIKLLRRTQDIPALAATQRALLARCLRLLKPGGQLLYCTCSILPAENTEVVQAVLASEPRARLQEPGLLRARLPAPLQIASGGVRTDASGMQLLPGNAALTDGFYYACLTVA
jgi:16S rRNA (cytosine967-C5)-methyltransferase